jgi:hypothetical protein
MTTTTTTMTVAVFFILILLPPSVAGLGFRRNNNCAAVDTPGDFDLDRYIEKTW